MRDAVVLAETFADHLTAGRIQEAAALLSPVTQAIGGSIKLQDLWRQIMTKFGALVSRTTLASHPLNGTMMVYFKFQFARGVLPGYAVCKDDKVDGFIFKHPDQLKGFEFLANEPEKAKPAAPSAGKKAPGNK